LAKDQWPNWVLGNHDRRRIATRVGGAQARVAAMLVLTLRGTPTLYYGDEIAMDDIPILPDLVKDDWEKNIPGLGLGRDPERSPMQWNSENLPALPPAPRGSLWLVFARALVALPDQWHDLVPPSMHVAEGVSWYASPDFSMSLSTFANSALE